MPKKLKWETFKETKEYKIWTDLERVCNEYDLTDETYLSREDLGGLWWEPLFDRLLKLAVGLKCNYKLKEIKMNWIRPILYFGAQSNGIIKYDGRTDIVDKGAIGHASVIRYSLKNIINHLRAVKDLDDKTFPPEYKDFKKELKYFFNHLAKYVKEGYRAMHEHVKLVLKPLRELRRAGYRLFSIEKLEANYRDLTLFKDKKDLKQFEDSIKDFFKWEQFKMKKETDMEMLDTFLSKTTNQNFYQYYWTNSVREVEKKEEFNPYDTQTNFKKSQREQSPSTSRGKTKSGTKISRDEQRKQNEIKAKQKLIYPNIDDLSQPQPTRFRKEAYQLQFEQGLLMMIEYLHERLKEDFPYVIDTHKIFVNLKYVPNGRKEIATKFYLDQLSDKIELLKLKCYEMKLNGLARVLMPITENKDIIKVIKEIFDLHVIIDNVMGNYLTHEQYMFIYKKIKFLTESTVKEEIEKIKNKDFMEYSVPKFVLFEAMCQSVDVINKMTQNSKDIGEAFKKEDYYQILKHDLENDNNLLFNAYELNDTFKRFMTPEIEEQKKIYFDEIKKFGRFWLMEGFFSKNDKQLWLDAIDILVNINELVREDIRDSIIHEKDEKVEIVTKEQSTKRRPSLRSSSRQDSGLSGIGKKSSKVIKHQKSKALRKRTNRRMSDSSLDESFEIAQKKVPNKLDGLRPPFVWNFPLERVIDMKKAKFARENEGEVWKTEIRNVDPTNYYHDHRVEKFNALLNQIFKNMMEYCKTEKADIWNYYLDKVLTVLGIHYYPFETKKEEKKEEEGKEIDNVISTENALKETTSP